MDFASLMSSEISKSKQSTSSSKPSSKYAKKSDVEAQREAAYLAEQKRLQEEKEARLAKKRKLEEEEAEQNREREEKKRKLAEIQRKRREEEEAEQERKRRKKLGLPELPPKGKDKENGTPVPEDDIEDEVLVEKLRGLNEPARLFGETHKARLRRFQRLTAPESRSSTPKQTTIIPTKLEILPDAEVLIDKVNLEKNPDFLYRQLTSYFLMILREWSIALAGRPEAVKTSFAGRAAVNAMEQSKEYLAPLIRHFERQDLESDLLLPIIDIVIAAQQRRYVDANDMYLKLSIGNAAWPIGVTMVGIHERSAREKLHEHGGNQAAHIMSDEVTRKFLQSIKRCLSFAQTKWPPFDQLQLMG